jgi:hypothetical protein
MAAKKWTVADNRERLIGGAKAMVDGLIETYPDLAPFETPLVKAMYDIGRIVGNHAASFGDDPDSNPAADSPVKPEPPKAPEPLPLGFSLYGAVDVPLVA